jgi:hypothetical protein
VDPAGRRDIFEDTFRPLTTAAVGSGALVLGVLGFVGQSWGAMPAGAQDLLAAAARAAFVTFALIATLGAVSFLLRERLGGALVSLVNLFSAGLFVAGVYVCGTVISHALAVGRPVAEPPEAIAVLLAVGVVGTGLLLAFLLLGYFVNTIRATTKPKPQEAVDE